MIEKIGHPEYAPLSIPCEDVLSLLDRILADNPASVSVAEVGVGIGATSCEIVRRLREEDSFYFFSFEEEVAALEEDLRKADFCRCKLYPKGNSRATFDSYNWDLGKLLLEKNAAFLDLVYMDGAHTFAFDGLACALMKELILPGGFLVFDDLNWTLSEDMEEHTALPAENSASDFTADYSKEQISARQVEMIVNVFMERDPEWVRFPSNPDWPRAIYRKKGKPSSGQITGYYMLAAFRIIQRKFCEKILWKQKKNGKKLLVRLMGEERADRLLGKK